MPETAVLEKTGVIFDIQRYSIHDGPGIRTTVFLKGCPLCCPWCANPESQLPVPEIECFQDKCVRCLHCADVCPSGAISESNGEVHLDRNRCEMCGRCCEECPAEARRVLGSKTTVQDILSVVERDRLFYERSGGGMTLSGGEPASQSEFSVALLCACKNRGLHTAIQTTGYQRWEVLQPIIANTDLVMLDIKVADPYLHQQLFGVSNDLILANARRMVDGGSTVVVRIPLVPGYTDTLENLQGIVDFAAHTGIGEITVLPYHRFGEPKYRRLGRSYRLAGQQVPSHEGCSKLLARLKRHGIAVRIGG